MSRTMAEVGRRMVVIKLKDYLDEHDIPLNWVHQATGIRYATLHGMYSGKTQSMNLYYLDAIMNVLNISDMNLLLEKVEEDL